MNNQITVTLVVAFLGLVALLSLGSTAWLLHGGINDAGSILAVSTPGSAAIGAIAGLLGSTAAAPRSGGSTIVAAEQHDPAA